MPLRTSRRSTSRGLPPGLAAGSRRLRRSHWVRVRSEGYRLGCVAEGLRFMRNYRVNLAFRTPFYIPGHGTPTVILFGRNRRPISDKVRAVLGIRGEPTTPEDPACGLV